MCSEDELGGNVVDSGGKTVVWELLGDIAVDVGLGWKVVVW